MVMSIYGSDLGRQSERQIEALRLAAAAMIPDLTGQFPAKLAEYQRAHDTDVSDYSFECKRHGDFLAVFMQRGPQTDRRARYPIDRKIVQAINLGQTKAIGITPGGIPDLTGRLMFKVASGSTVNVDWPVPSRHFPMIWVRIDEKADHYGQMLDRSDIFGGMHLPDAPRLARDDTLNFQGCGVTIYAPAGMGQQVYDAILREVGRGFAVQEPA